jgi:hypothetical protein
VWATAAATTVPTDIRSRSTRYLGFFDIAARHALNGKLAIVTIFLQLRPNQLPIRQTSYLQFTPLPNKKRKSEHGHQSRRSMTMLSDRLKQCAPKRIRSRGSYPWAIVHAPTGLYVQGPLTIFNHSDLGPQQIPGPIFFHRKRDAQTALETLRSENDNDRRLRNHYMKSARQELRLSKESQNGPCRENFLNTAIELVAASRRITRMMLKRCALLKQSGQYLPTNYPVTLTEQQNR